MKLLPDVPGIGLRLRFSDEGSGRRVLFLYPAHSQALESKAIIVEDVPNSRRRDLQYPLVHGVLSASPMAARAAGF